MSSQRQSQHALYTPEQSVPFPLSIVNSSMLTVYYLVHLDSQRPLKYYHTRSGARIAQRARNHRLGFTQRIERVTIGESEYERCLDRSGRIVDATWYILEGTIDSPDLLDSAP